MIRLICIVLGTVLTMTKLEAAVIMFDNADASFVWLPNGDTLPRSRFDPTVAVMQQSNASTARQLLYFANPGGGSTTVGADIIQASAVNGVTIAIRSTPIVVNGPSPGQQTTFSVVPEVYAPGQSIGSTASYVAGASVGYSNPTLGRFNFLGQHPFIGFRVTLDDGQPHYGWIELDYRSSPLPGTGTVNMYQPIRWAYETEPNTPITVPASTAAVLLAGVGAAAAGRRQRS